MAWPRRFFERSHDFEDGQQSSQRAVAPRAQLSMEGVNNTHENPVGSQATYTAARTIYDWLGASDRLGIFFHPGAHPMNDV